MHVGKEVVMYVLLHFNAMREQQGWLMEGMGSICRCWTERN